MADASGAELAGVPLPALPPAGPVRPPRTTAGQKRPRLYDGVAAEPLSRPSAVARVRPSAAKPAVVTQLPPLPDPAPDVVERLYAVGWARSPGYPFWPCVIVDPGVAVEFPAVHSHYVSSSLPRKALVQYFGMHAPQFEVVSVPPGQHMAAVDPAAHVIGDDPVAGARTPAGPAFMPWGCSRHMEFQTGASRIPSKRANLRRAFKQAVLEAQKVHEEAPGGGLPAISLLASLPGLRVPRPPSSLAERGLQTHAVAAGIIPGLIQEAEGAGMDTLAVPAAPLTDPADLEVPPPPDRRHGNDDVWGLDGGTTEDEV